MKRLRICAVITDKDVPSIRRAAELADLFEVRIDMIGEGWREIVPALTKPWIAANRSVNEHGKWNGGEEGRIKELLSAAGLGASVIDIELNAEGLKDLVPQIKKKKVGCLISHHDWQGTPPTDELAAIVRRQIKAGADICKLVTTAVKIEDNIPVLEVIRVFPSARIVSFAMGAEGRLSRVLAPRAGSYFTYASTGSGKESAPGQVPAEVMRRLLGLVR
ncbi:MAG: type I 3-dehydroquinate dehydratase [Dehalococcoidia bacterium]|jgi:3-dehydroquinate dehydratase type I